MSVSIVAFMIVDQIALFKYLPESVGISIYGGYKILGKGDDVVHTFNLPTHLKVRIKATILLEDSWDKEILQFSVDGNVVQEFTKNVHEGFDGCGNSDFQEEWFDLYWEGDHTANTLVVKFVNNLDEETSNESWGFIDFQVYILSECYYLYTECGYQGTEYIFCSKTPKQDQEQFIQPIKSFRVPLGSVLLLQNPGFYGGVLQYYTTDQNCIDPFTFPKKIYIPEPRK